MSYEVACDGELSVDDVSVEWATLMDGTEPSEDDQIAVPFVSPREHATNARHARNLLKNVDEPVALVEVAAPARP